MAAVEGELDPAVLQLDEVQTQGVAIRAARGRTGSSGRTWSVMAVARGARRINQRYHIRSACDLYRGHSCGPGISWWCLGEAGTGVGSGVRLSGGPTRQPHGDLPRVDEV